MLRASADAAQVRSARRAAGRVQIPGDKSISHRYALLGALADGDTRITGYSSGADCAATLACLRALGVPIEARDGTVHVTGRGLGGLTPAARPVDAANSGTTMRLLAGIVAAHPFRTVITGDASLSRRPMRRVIAPLTDMGATIQAQDGRPPLTIDGAPLRGISYRPEVPSAQVKSSLLLAGLHATGRTVVAEPSATRDHTERALAAFGVTVEREGLSVAITPGQRLRARDLTVPGDVSGAAFWGALAAGLPGSVVEIAAVGLNPSRTGVLDVLRRAGAEVEVVPDPADQAGEPVGRVTIRHREPRSFTVAPEEVPGLIDELPALGALGTLLPRGCVMEVRGAAELRVKESDRISALAAGFRALGADVTEYPDGFRIESRPLRGATVDAAGDHRLAMAFAVAACGADSPTTITGAGAVDVSYPGFFEELARLTTPGGGR
jgi:3-phosphoshikimate 1-carboxyvinyltransferase